MAGRKRAAGAGKRKRKHVKGDGFLDTIKSGANTVNDFLKSSKVISNSAKALSNVPQLAPYATTIGGVAGALGYGKRGGAKRKKMNF